MQREFLGRIIVATLLVVHVTTINVLTPPCPPECICLSQTQVLCNSGGLTEIPVKLLPPTVEHLSLTRNHFPVIRNDAFAGLRALKKLSLDGNNISIIKPFAFRGLPRLRELSIQHTPLATVAQFAFAGLQNISSIFLSHNKIHKVEGYAFAGTSNVQVLQLSYNPIHTIEKLAFAGLTNIEKLIFPSGIRTVEPDAFSGLDTVGFMKLAFMDLKSLKPFTFRGLTHVNMLSIQESDLGTIQAGAFEGMTHIASLNFLNNKIDAIQELPITLEHHIKSIRFQGNHILDIPLPGTVTFYGVEILIVVSNHFPCDCHIHNLIEGPFANGSVEEFMARNFCISPLEVNGKLMSSLDLDAIGRCQEQVTRENLEASKETSSHTRDCRLNRAIFRITLLLSLLWCIVFRSPRMNFKIYIHGSDNVPRVQQ